MTHYLRLIVNPNKDEMEKIGRQSADFLKSRKISEELIQDQIAILKELINSSLRFGHCRPGSSVTVLIQVGECAVMTEVVTPMGRSSSLKLEELEQTIQLLRGYQSSLEAYLKYRQTSGIDGSIGLGLARITHENKAMVDFFVDDKKILSLSAVRPLDGSDTNRCETGRIRR